MDADTPSRRTSAHQHLSWLEHLKQMARRHEPDHASVRVVWRQFGQGPDVVLLHGGHGSWLHWARNIESLAQRHTLWLPDLPGYGDSDTPEPRMDALVRATCATLNTLLGAKRTVPVLGFSFGGLVAAHVARLREGATPLALFGPGGHGGPRRPIGALQSWRLAAQQGDGLLLDQIMRHNLMMHMLHAPHALDDAAAQIHAASCQATRFASKPISHAGGLFDVLADHPDPLRIIWGAHDVTADPLGLVEHLRTRLPRCETHIVPDAGHWVQYEASQAANQLVLDWLAQVLSGRRQASVCSH